MEGYGGSTGGAGGVTPTAGTPAAGTHNRQGSRALSAGVKQGEPRSKVALVPPGTRCDAPHAGLGWWHWGRHPDITPGPSAHPPFSIFHPVPLFPSHSPPSSSSLLPPGRCKPHGARFSLLLCQAWSSAGPGSATSTSHKEPPTCPIRTPQPGHGAPGRPLALPCPALPCLAAACSALGLPSSISKDTWVRGRAPRRFRELAELGKKPPRLFPSCSPPRHSRTSPRRWHAASPPRTRTSPGSAEQAGGAATGTPASGLHLWDVGWDEHPPAPG